MHRQATKINLATLPGNAIASHYILKVNSLSEKKEKKKKVATHLHQHAIYKNILELHPPGPTNHTPITLSSLASHTIFSVLGVLPLASPLYLAHPLTLTM